MILLTTPLDSLHRELGARMVPFAGYDMPVQYPTGILAEHRHTRNAAGLFDVSHMGQFVVQGPEITATLEALLPADLQALPVNRQTYTLLMNDSGGVRDDLIVTRWSDDSFFLVVNAACKEADREWIESQLAPQQQLRELDDRSLIAVQGPRAREIVAALIPELAQLAFLQGCECQWGDASIYATCSGYTGEDGYELSIPAAQSEALVREILKSENAAMIGLGARDSLRLEAGLCLYGHELNQEITPIAARLQWAIAKARRPGGERAGGYPGAHVVARDMENGSERLRVGLQVQGKRPVREGQTLLSESGQEIGIVTSGGFGATVDAPIAMGYVDREYASIGQELTVDLRGKSITLTVTKTPFVTQNYYRG